MHGIGATYLGEKIIPSGEINFSEKVRNIPELQIVVNWLHIIMGFSIISILIMEIWFTLLKCLGVSTSIYEQQQDEIERLNRLAEMEQDKYAVKTYVTTVTSGKSRKSYTTERQRLR